MAYSERASSFLPTIKCSMCAQDIEISHMGDHVCGAPVATPSTAGEREFDAVPVSNGSVANIRSDSSAG